VPAARRLGRRPTPPTRTRSAVARTPSERSSDGAVDGLDYEVVEPDAPDRSNAPEGTDASVGTVSSDAPDGEDRSDAPDGGNADPRAVTAHIRATEADRPAVVLDFGDEPATVALDERVVPTDPLSGEDVTTADPRERESGGESSTVRVEDAVVRRFS